MAAAVTSIRTVIVDEMATCAQRGLVRTNKKILLGDLLVSALMILAVFPRQIQPSYGGRPPSELLAFYEVATKAQRDTRTEETALKSIGTNPVPWLLGWPGNDTHVWKLALYRMWEAIDWRINSNRLMTDIHLTRPARAPYGFKALGANSAFAVPGLSRVLTGGNDLASFHSAISLAYIGEPGWSVLFTALTNRDDRICNNPCFAIEDLRTNAAPAIPIMVRDLNDLIPAVRRRAHFIETARSGGRGRKQQGPFAEPPTVLNRTLCALQGREDERGDAKVAPLRPHSPMMGVMRG